MIPRLSGGPHDASPFRRGILGSCFYNLCSTFSSCLYVLCCCCLIEQCLGGGRNPLFGSPAPGPPPPPRPSFGPWSRGPTEDPYDVPGQPGPPGPPTGPVERAYY